MGERGERPSDGAEPRPTPGVEGDRTPPQVRPALGPTAMSPHPWTTGGVGQGTGSTRWASIGCGAVVLALIALLLAGVSLTKRTAWMAFARGRQRLVEVVGREHPTQRLRTSRNLEHFAAGLRASRDPYRALGQFLDRERGALADGRLDAGELEDLNRFLEGVAPPSGAEPAP